MCVRSQTSAAIHQGPTWMKHFPLTSDGGRRGCVPPYSTSSPLPRLPSELEVRADESFLASFLLKTLALPGVCQMASWGTAKPVGEQQWPCCNLPLAASFFHSQGRAARLLLDAWLLRGLDQRMGMQIFTGCHHSSPGPGEHQVWHCVMSR